MCPVDHLNLNKPVEHIRPLYHKKIAGGTDYIIDIKYPQHAPTNLLHISQCVRRRWAILHNNDGDEIE